MRRPEQRAAARKKSFDAAAVSTQTHQDGGQRTGQQANGSRYALDKAGNRAQSRREADQLRTSIAPLIQFTLTELSTGLTLSTLAGERQGAAKTRTRIKARAAYDSALRFSGRLVLREEESHMIRTGLEALKRSLEALGETFPTYACPRVSALATSFAPAVAPKQ